MLATYSAIRSFFMHSRVELPRDRWDPGAGTREPARGRLTVEAIRQVVQASGLRDRAVFLTLFQGLMDQERFCEFNRKYGSELTEHLQANGPEKPFRVDFMKGRKSNHSPFYTYLGRDALEAWREYFEKERGWPKPKEPIATVRNGRHALAKDSIRHAFYTLCAKFKLRDRHPGGHDKGHRTGMNIHEFRDVARSHLQTAKRDKLDETCVEFWMGHSIDPLNYNKFAELNPKYVEENYRIAERYLNILSRPLPDEEAKKDQERIQKLEEELLEVKRLVERMKTEHDS